jgi:hypothetical protein
MLVNKSQILHFDEKILRGTEPPAGASLTESDMEMFRSPKLSGHLSAKKCRAAATLGRAGLRQQIRRPEMTELLRKKALPGMGDPPDQQRSEKEFFPPFHPAILPTIFSHYDTLRE